MNSSILISAILLASGSLALASGTVTNLAQSDLEAAMQDGGAVLIGVTGTLTLTQSITVTRNTTLDAGTNSHLVRISGGNQVRLFLVASNVSFSIKGIELADGRIVGTNGPADNPYAPGGDAFGAGILNQGGSVLLTDCTLTNHSARGGDSGAITMFGGANTGPGGNALGAALFSFRGTLSLTNCLVTDNSVTGGGGSTAPAGHAWGGAIYVEDGTVSLANVTLRNCSAAGGGLGNGSPIGLTGNCRDGSGGALFATNSTVLLVGCIMQNNRVTGGSYASQPLAGGSCGDGLGGALFVDQGSAAFLQLSQFFTNSASGGSAIMGTSSGAGRGGAVFCAGVLQLAACTFSGCQSVGGGGSPGSGTARPGQGGAVFSSNDLAVNGCTFVNNSAIGGGGNDIAGRHGEGGAIWGSGSYTATNATFAANAAIGGPFKGTGNAAPGSAIGGAIFISNATAMLVNITVAFNGAYSTNLLQLSGPMLGGGISSTNSSVTLRNSIIANSDSGGDVWGTVVDGGYNICSDGTANFSAIKSFNQANPMLSAMSQNGGPTATMGLLVGSPARDAIPTGFPPTDQRGVPRAQGPAADIGAFEADFVDSAPTIVIQAVSQNVRAGGNVDFTVGASGTAPLSYQWFKAGVPINGATQSTLSLSNVQAIDAAAYLAVVTNTLGSATSQVAVLVVDSTPVILQQPAGLVISPAGNASFSILAEGPSLAYQWWHDTVPLSGATSSSLVIQSAMAGAQGGYYVVVTNFSGAVTSTPATLAFDSSALSILVAPKGLTVEAGFPATFSVLISGIPPFFYQWQHDGALLPGATNSALTLPAVSTDNAGAYAVVVTNGYGSVISSNAQLTVTPGATRPTLVIGRSGTTVTITFTAEAGRMYRLLASSDLVTWSGVSTNSAITAGPLQIVRTIGPVPAIFYRVITP